MKGMEMRDTAFFASVILSVAALTAPATAAEPGAAAAANSVNDKRIICRKTPVTGSLIKKERQCFTKAEWDHVAEVQRRGNEKMVDGLTSRSQGN